jgi:sulfate transport system substrate-binding protein
MWIRLLAIVAGLYVTASALWLLAGGIVTDSGGTELLNVSYDPTRELYRDLNQAFVARYQNDHGIQLVVKQSHGGSGSQARAVIDGLGADVVTLALHSDVDAIRARGLIEDGWDKRLPLRSLPYYSTIVFVVRAGNPKGIHDWQDLTRPGIAVITPNPKTSGNGRLSLWAAWGALRYRGGSEAETLEYVKRLYRNVPVLDSGARGSTVTFAQRNLGDVHLAWENEAHLEVQESAGKLQIVYPPISLRAEPPVAVVDANVKHKGTRAAAEAYLKWLYSAEAQEIIARNFYRPSSAEVLQRHAGTFPALTLYPITTVAASWEDAQERFCGEGGIFDQIYGGTPRWRP